LSISVPFELFHSSTWLTSKDFWKGSHPSPLSINCHVKSLNSMVWHNLKMNPKKMILESWRSSFDRDGPMAIQKSTNCKVCIFTNIKILGISLNSWHSKYSYSNIKISHSSNICFGLCVKFCLKLTAQPQIYILI
jgi:hypothetical protein